MCFLKRLFPLFACFFAAACANAVVVHDWRSFFYVPGEFEHATRKGAIQTIVAGNPFDGNKSEFDARIFNLMLGQSRVLDVKFVGKPAPQTDPRFRVVVAFNLPTSSGNSSICRDAAKLSSAPKVANMDILMVFCDGNYIKSNARATVKGIKSIDDPKFARVVRQLTYFMTPDDDLLRQRQYHD